MIPSLCTRKDPPPCDAELYKQRHKVENFFRKLFDFRRAATRYEKLASSFLAIIHLSCAIVFLRSIR